MPVKAGIQVSGGTFVPSTLNSYKGDHCLTKCKPSITFIYYIAAVRPGPKRCPNRDGVPHGLSARLGFLAKIREKVAFEGISSGTA